MRFEIVHEFEIPRDALELAVLSPNLIDKLGKRLPNVEHVQQKTHALADGVLERVWSYQANVSIPAFAKQYLTREMCAWDERSTYSIKTHSSSWSIRPHVKPEWQKFFTATGTYELVDSKNGTTRRVVRGELELRVPLVMRQLGERMIVAEVKKTFEAEAATLRDLATLA
jgi:hypothetical protein